MTDRDRLIELCNEKTNTMTFNNSDHWFDFHKKISEIIDHLLTNGVTVLPVPIGSTVYEIRARGEREYGKHRKYDYSPDTNLSLRNAIIQKATLYIAPKKFCKTDKARLNKTVFLTKEEAEDELQKRCKNA